jgi:Tfp pilus assembly protein PilO
MSFYLKLIYLKSLNIISKLHLVLKLFITLILLFLIIGIWYLNFYTESINQITQELQIINSTENEKLKLEKIIKKFTNDPQDIDILNKNINNLFDEDMQTPEKYIEELLQYAQSANLTVNNFEEKALSDRKGYFKKNINFNLVGDFYQVLNFLQTIANSCSVIKFNKFTINRLKEGALKINFICTVYSPKDK